MATFLIWVLILQHFITRSSSQINCKRDLVGNTTFDCKLWLNNANLSLRCESLPQSSYHQSYKTFLLLHLYSKENNEDFSNFQEMFRSLLHSPSSSNSGFYSCDNDWRNIIRIDSIFLSGHCVTHEECTRQSSNFINESSIRNVEISNTGNSVIFGGLDQFSLATEVSIHNTFLANISQEFFGNSTELTILTLRANNINYLPNGVFSALENLENLDLSQNKIRAISKFSLGALHKLRLLNLSHNSLSELSDDAFIGIHNLEAIYLMNNKLLTIYENTFTFNKYLKKVDLSYNNLKQLPEQIFHSLQYLEEISCSRCKLIELNKNLFLDLKKLSKMDFSKNEIETLDTNTFKQQISLSILNLSYNRISVIPEFRNQTYFKVLNLFHNEIMYLNENFSVEVPYMYDFNVGENRIKVLTDIHVKGFKDLEIFDLSRNNITVVELGMTNKVNIRKLDLSNNSIEIFKVKWRQFEFLEELNMVNNLITYLELPPCIPSIKQTVTFSFQNNKISKLDVKSLVEDQNRVQTNQIGGCLFNGLSKNFVDISNNPLMCDCTLYPFYKYLKQENGVKLDKFLKMKSLKCSGPQFLQNKSIIELPDHLFSCYFKTNCPEPCLCGVRGKDNRTFVYCSTTGLREAPQNIPLETSVLYFYGNKLDTLMSINSECWNNLVELRADNNTLTTLEGWKIPKNLRYLSLRENKIKNLPENLMNFIANQSNFQLMLGGNDRKCNCKRKRLKTFINENKAFIKDIEDIVCDIDNNGTNYQLPLYTVPDSVLCPKTILLSFNPKVTIISMCSIFVLLLTVLLIYYKQRQLILSFLYIHCDEVFRVCFEEHEADDDKVFDAFVAYSSCDRHIVMDLLLELEEKEPHFQLCIHERNWLPGRFISDNIISSVQHSKRTIIVLSNDFISSPWFRLEVRAAIFRVSGDKKNKIIVILADKSTSLDGIDTEIRHVISKRTYLVWGERWFWEKLRYSMPRKSCLEKGDENHSEDTPCNERDIDIPLLEDV